MPFIVVPSQASSTPAADYAAPTGVQIPHLAAPFQLSAAGAAVVEQNSNDEILACVDNIVHCNEGFLLDEPEFGIPFLQFGNAPLNTTGVATAINQWEPRAQITMSEQAGSGSDQERIVTIGVSGGTD